MGAEGMDPRQLLDELELRLGAMDNKRVLASQDESREISELIETVSAEYDSEAAKWYETTFHPIDESDPMLQATKSLKW